MGRGNVWTSLEAEKKREGEKKEDKLGFLRKCIVLLGSPGSVPRAQLRVNFSYWIPSRDIITSKGYYYPEGFRWNHLCVTLEMQGVTIVIWQHGTCQDCSFQGRGIVDIILPWVRFRGTSLCFSGFFSSAGAAARKLVTFTKTNRKQQQKQAEAGLNIRCRRCAGRIRSQVTVPIFRVLGTKFNFFNQKRLWKYYNPRQN